MINSGKFNIQSTFIRRIAKKCLYESIYKLKLANPILHWYAFLGSHTNLVIYFMFKMYFNASLVGWHFYLIVFDHLSVTNQPNTTA